MSGPGGIPMDAWPTLPGFELTLDEQISKARSELYTTNLEARDAQLRANSAGWKLDALLQRRVRERENGTVS